MHPIPVHLNHVRAPELRYDSVGMHSAKAEQFAQLGLRQGKLILPSVANAGAPEAERNIKKEVCHRLVRSEVSKSEAMPQAISRNRSRDIPGLGCQGDG